jgi:hypothetical protein
MNVRAATTRLLPSAFSDWLSQRNKLSDRKRRKAFLSGEAHSTTVVFKLGGGMSKVLECKSIELN